MILVAPDCYCQFGFCRELGDSLEAGSGSHRHSLLIKLIQLPSAVYRAIERMRVFFYQFQTLITKTEKTTVLKFGQG